MGTVLVVDDEFGIADLIEAILSDEGYRVLKASNGRQGLEALSKEPVDLVFLDYMMPVMAGGAMLESMSADATLRTVPVVVMSSLPEASVADRSAGYVAFMRKPFRIAQVLDFATRFAPDLSGRP